MNAAPRSSTREAGISLVEMIAVIAILLVLLSIGVYALRSMRMAGQLTVAKSAAQAYADAVDEFARDHGNRYPASSGTEWPTPLEQGPRAPLVDGVGRRYLRQVPEGVQDGKIVVATSAAASMPTIVYKQLNAGLGYVIELHVPNSPPCALVGGNATTKLNECTRR